MSYLNGCYAKLKTASEHLHYCGEFPGDNVCKDKPTTNPFGTYFTYQHTVNNGGLSTVWNSAYNIISQTSSLMKMINENESPELNQKLGEAYYMRGMMYFLSVSCVWPSLLSRTGEESGCTYCEWYA